jgi:hypothetical protein
MMKMLQSQAYLFPVTGVTIFLIWLTPDWSNGYASLLQICLVLALASGEPAILRQTQMETTLFR